MTVAVALVILPLVANCTHQLLRRPCATNASYCVTKEGEKGEAHLPRFSTMLSIGLLLLFVQLGAVLSNQHPTTCEICSDNIGNHHSKSSTMYHANDTVCTTLGFAPNAEGAAGSSPTPRAARPTSIVFLPSCIACTEDGLHLYPMVNIWNSDENTCLNVTFAKRERVVDSP